MADFRELNKFCKKEQVVFVGSSFFSGVDITSKILHEKNITNLVYDRSSEKLTIENALSYLNNNVFCLEPSKIFVNIGDEDLKSAGFDLTEFINKYEWMLLNIHRSCKNCRIYITSVVSASLATKNVNSQLYNLAKDTGCTFINFNSKKKDRNSYNKVFNILKQYLVSSDALPIVG